MEYTTHGHRIPGADVNVEYPPPIAEICGGPNVCWLCASESIIREKV